MPNFELTWSITDKYYLAASLVDEDGDELDEIEFDFDQILGDLCDDLNEDPLDVDNINEWDELATSLLELGQSIKTLIHGEANEG